MKRITLLFLLFVWASVISSAQTPTLPEQCQAFYPQLLQKNPVLNETDANDFMKNSNYGQHMALRNKTFWVVYSDRADNVTYTEPGGKEKYSTLDFNQRLRIAQIKDSYALVYVEPMEAIEYPLISKNAVCKGWIPMKNLLLWHNCLANEWGIYKKALLCVNLDKVDTENSNFGLIYKNPSDKRNFEQGTTDFQFYFVMKREGNLSLLAKSHTMEGISDDGVLLGWVSEQSYVAWSQRTCLEPTWDKESVEYFAGNNDTIKVYSDKELTNIATTIPFFMRDISADEYNKMDQMQKKFRYRMSPYLLRFPILEGSTSTLYNCNSFGSVSGEIVYNPNNDDPFRIIEQKLKALTNINICLCIDGTSSMESFYPTVAAAIKEGVKFFRTNANVRVGAVIYRDYVDGPNYVQETFPLTSPNNEMFFDFLKRGGEYGIKSSSKDRTLEEALYNGMNTALDKVGFKPDQSNILFVIGDCGNARSDTKFTKDQLVRKIVDKNVHVIGFQVRTGSQDAFTLFNEQMIDIIMESLEMKYKALCEDMTGSFRQSQDGGYNYENVVNSNIYIGSLYYPYKVKEMDLTKLTSLMGRSFQYCSESVKDQIELLNPLNICGFIHNTEDISQKINENFVISRIGEDMYRQLLESNSLVGFKGYAKKKSESGRPYFKPVLYISADEFNALLERLAPVNDAALLENNNREPYVRALKALAQSMIPEDLTDERLGSMGYKEIMSRIAGLNEPAGALKGNFTIDEIASPQKMSLEVYKSLVKDFARKFKELQKIANRKYEYTREINGVKYFWLPIEDLP